MAQNPQKRIKSPVTENIEAIVIALLLAIVIRTFVIQAFKIPSGSMLPTLKIGDYILVNKFIYGIKMPFTGTVIVPITNPKPNDIIVFEYPRDPSLDYIKRVIAVAGDTVEIRDKKLFVNGKPFNDVHGMFTDPHIFGSTDYCNFDTTQRVPQMHPPDLTCPRDNLGPFTVPPGKVFAMGDNRDNSYDGRFWGFVDLKAIRGKAFLIYWSWDLDQSLFSLDRFRSIRWGRIGHLVH